MHKINCKSYQGKEENLYNDKEELNEILVEVEELYKIFFWLANEYDASDEALLGA